MVSTFVKNEKYKLLATLVVAGFFLFFWIKGPLQRTLEIINLETEETEYAKPIMVGEKSINTDGFGTVKSQETDGFGHGLILDKKGEEHDFAMLDKGEEDFSKSEEAAEKVLAHARELIGNDAKLELKATPEMYYVSITNGNQLVYIESRGIVQGIRGYAGPVHIGLFVNEDGTIRSVHHISSKETESYLQKIQRTGFYAQFEKLKIAGNHEVDAVSGATLTSETIAETASALVGAASNEPLADFASIDSIDAFNVEAKLTWWWILHIGVIFLMFLYGYLKRIKKSKRAIIALSILSVLYIGFFLNNSFTYVSFIHPFVGTSVSSLVGLYAAFTLLGAIWGKNTYCKYVCPFGNVQRLMLQITPKKMTAKFPLSNKWIKRVRGAIAVVLIVGVLMGLRNWSNYELFPDLFGLDYMSVWLFVSLATVLLTVRYPMIWCRLLCPTGSVLDFISDSVNYKPKKK